MVFAIRKEPENSGKGAALATLSSLFTVSVADLQLLFL